MQDTPLTRVSQQLAARGRWRNRALVAGAAALAVYGLAVAPMIVIAVGVLAILGVLLLK